MGKVILIDGDGLTYHASKDGIEESIKLLDEKIANIFNTTEGDEYCIFLSNTPYFRHVIYPEYKGQRKKYNSPLKWLKTLKAYMKEKYHTYTMKDVEADDLCSYYYYKFKRFKLDVVLSSPDKDLLESIPGTHFNYRYYKDKDGNLTKGEFKTTTFEKAVKFSWYQMIVGDSSDNIKGVEGVGRVGANAILSNVNKNNDYSHAVLKAYVRQYGTVRGVYEFQKNFRVLYMLSTDEDFLREVGSIPNADTVEVPETPKDPTVFYGGACIISLVI